MIIPAGLIEVSVTVPFVTGTTNATIYLEGSIPSSVDQMTVSSTDPAWQSRFDVGKLNMLQRRWYYTSSWPQATRQLMQVDQCTPHMVGELGWSLVFVSLPEESQLGS
jgi:hypothetical protein